MHFIKRLASLTVPIGFCLTVAFLAIEFILRVSGYGSLIVYEPDSQLYWVPKPMQESKTRVGRYPVRVNSHGTRGVEFEVPKPTGVFRILSLGDSRAFGWGLPEEKTYAALLESTLNNSLNGKAVSRVEVINAGVNAWTYPQIEMYLSERGMALQPDLVIIGDADLWMHFNESQGDVFRKAFRETVESNKLLRRSAAYHFMAESDYASFYSHHRSKSMTAMALAGENQLKIADANPVDVYRYCLEEMAALTRRDKCRCVIFHTPQKDHLLLSESSRKTTADAFDHRHMQDLKMDVAKSLDVTFVDVMQRFQSSDTMLYLEEDLMHPNKEGSRIIARELAKAIVPLIPDIPLTRSLSK